MQYLYKREVASLGCRSQSVPLGSPTFSRRSLQAAEEVRGQRAAGQGWASPPGNANAASPHTGGSVTGPPAGPPHHPQQRASSMDAASPASVGGNSGARADTPAQQGGADSERASSPAGTEVRAHPILLPAWKPRCACAGDVGMGAYIGH